eukprot:TRINITY_DN1717_c0_g1_i1.p3 TRINITY_DN1717_c0_g1~~TRINITY_DN1717_c0_g1_i1.p3  ORF type:complete len:371 (-),score=35.56 TRINITY_DN1717_c0_g1_i1:4925-6037(-)
MTHGTAQLCLYRKIQVDLEPEPVVESSGGFCSCCIRYPEEIIGEQYLLQEGKEIKELFPVLAKEIKISLSMDKEDSLCPSFMKSGSISILISQPGLSLSKSLRNLSPDTQKQEVRKESEPLEEPKDFKQELHERKFSNNEADSNSASKGKRNRKFTREEDEKLKALVKTYGEGCWSQIAEKMGGRNRKQIRERYINFLKKERVASEFTAEEDNIIINFVQEKGRKWSSIAELLPGRTPIMIKNRYYAKLKRALKLNEKDRTGSPCSSHIDFSSGEGVSPPTSSSNGFGRTAYMNGTKEDTADKISPHLEKCENVKEDLETLKLQEKKLREVLMEIKQKIGRIKASSENQISISILCEWNCSTIQDTQSAQ